MKAAIYNPYWETLGGGEKYMATVTRLLLDKGYSVDIWWKNNMSEHIKDRFSLDIHEAQWTEKRPSHEYDVVCILSDGSLPVSLAKKTIIHLQFPFENVSGKSPLNLIKSRFYTFVVNSRFTKSSIDKEYLVNSHVVYPPVSCDNFLPGRKKNIILYVGRFSQLAQRKGQDVLIDSFRRLQGRIPEWKLVLAGGAEVGMTSEMWEVLSRKAHGYHIELIKNPDFSTLQKLYASAKIFWSASGYSPTDKVMPYQMEHFGISVVESMAAGCVPIVTNRGGHPEIVDSGLNGLLWENTDQLEEMTLSLIDDPHNLNMLSQAAQKKSRIFDESAFYHSFSSLLES